MRILMLVVLFGCAFAAQPAVAQEPAATVRACVTGTEIHEEIVRRACVGAASRACINRAPPDSQETANIVACARREGEQWRALSADYVRVLRQRESASQRAALNRLLAQHARWRETRCAYAATLFPAGYAARRVDVAFCERDADAELALILYPRVYVDGVDP
jgi:hypothetical protein